MPVVLITACLRGRGNTRAMFHITRIKNSAWIKPVSPSLMPARALFHLRELFYLASCFYLLVKLTPARTHRRTHTLAADPNEVPKYGEQKVCRGVKGEAEQKTNK